MKIKRMDRLPKRKVTIANLLDKDGVLHVLEGILADKEKIEDIIVIWQNEGETFLQWRDNMGNSRVVWAFERIKKTLLEVD